MYDLQYVRKKRRRRIAALVSLFAAIGVTSLVVTSFLGRQVGTFTVAIKNSSVQLALSEKQSFENKSSYLRIDNIPKSYQECSFNWFGPSEMSLMDSENTDYLYGKTSDGESLYYLKYTFYVKNIGATTAHYHMYINLDESVRADNGETLDKNLRIMVFENNPAVEDSHNYEVYAKNVEDYRYVVKDKNGDRTYQAIIADTPYPDADNIVREDDDHPLATSFRYDLHQGNAVIDRHITGFKQNDVLRYTVVYWLEGESSVQKYDENGDPIIPKNAKIKLSIDIMAGSYNS